ncbi:MAG: hypothetical protein MMC23_000914 [Stictis urceolatum]|nr:hypothetical protein [Stictis urceolata]
MVWPFTSSSNGAGDKPLEQQDPLKNLDPSLREFLEKESPVRYQTSPSPSAPSLPPIAPPTASSAPSTTAPSKGQPAAPSPSQPTPPMVYKDGRYAHIWKTYTPQRDVEAAFQSPEEKLQNIIQAYKQRRSSIGAAAMENCAFQQWEQNECLRAGSFSQKLNMCREESRSFERCYTMNAKFLKALGYLSTYERSEAEEERVQMHADRLFRTMVEREEQVEAARREGREEPVFGDIMGEVKGEGDLKVGDLKPGVRKELEESVKKLEGVERDVAVKARLKEIEAELDLVNVSKDMTVGGEKERAERRAKGQSTPKDRFFALFGK